MGFYIINRMSIKCCTTVQIIIDVIMKNNMLYISNSMVMVTSLELNCASNICTMKTKTPAVEAIPSNYYKAPS